MLGPSPAEKFPKLFPLRGHGVIPDTVFPYPGNSVQVIPATEVLRDACAASIDTPPSPSTNPRIKKQNKKENKKMHQSNTSNYKYGPEVPDYGGDATSVSHHDKQNMGQENPNKGRD